MSADADVICFAGAVENIGSTAFGSGFSTGFIYVRSTQSIQFLAHTSQGLLAPQFNLFLHGVSDDGRYVLFTSDAANLAGLGNVGVFRTYRYDRLLDVYEPVILDMFGQPTAATNAFAKISPDGRFVAFGSSDSNLVPNDTNNTNDVFLRDMTTTLIERISVASGGTQNPISSLHPNAISPDGRFVLFVSSNANLDPTVSGNGSTYYLRDRFTNTTRAFPANQLGIAPGPSTQFVNDEGCLMTPSNRVIISTTDYLPQVNGIVQPSQIWMTDLDGSEPALLTRTATGDPANFSSTAPVVSPNGRHVVFATGATNLDPADTNMSVASFDIYKVDINCFVGENVIGVGKPGTAGVAPFIFASNVPCDEATSIVVAGGLGGAPAYLGVGVTPPVPAVIAGSPIYFDLAQPNLGAPFPNLGLPGVPAAGSFIVTIDLTGFSGFSFTFQSFFVDSGAQGGFSSSPGLVVSVF
jgi:hypothetical protein